MARPRKPREEDPWPQRLRFLELVQAKLDAGATLDEIAQALGLDTTSSLTSSYRHDYTRKPKRKVMEKAAAYFGVPRSEIDGDAVSVPLSQEETEYQQGLYLIKTAQGTGIVEKLSREDIIHIGHIAIATAKAYLSNK